jgi:hypothetical protein
LLIGCNISKRADSAWMVSLFESEEEQWNLQGQGTWYIACATSILGNGPLSWHLSLHLHPTCHKNYRTMSTQ